MSKILFIGSSNIIEEHIKVAIKVGLKLYSINSTRQNSRNQKIIEKKYNFEKKFSNWKDAVNFAGNDNNIALFCTSGAILVFVLCFPHDSASNHFLGSACSKNNSSRSSLPTLNIPRRWISVVSYRNK